MISSQAAAPSNTANGWRGLNSANVVASASGSDNLFQALFEEMAAGVPASVGQTVTTPKDVAAATGAASAKASDAKTSKAPGGDASQGNAAALLDGGSTVPSPISWMLNSFVMQPVPTTATNQPAASPAPTSSVDGTSDDALIAPQNLAGALANVQTATFLTNLTTADATTISQSRTAALNSPAVAPETSIQTGLNAIAQTAAADIVQSVTSPSVNDADAPQSPTANQNVHPSQIASPQQAQTIAMQPVFTAAIRTAATLPLGGTSSRVESPMPPQAATGTATPAPVNAPLPQAAGINTPAPQPASLTQTPPNAVAVDLTTNDGSGSQSAASVTASSSAMNSQLASIGSQANSLVSKPDATGTNTNGKSTSDQTDERQSFITTLDPTLTAPTPNKIETGTGFQVQSGRPVTEYVASERTQTAQSTGPVTDIRLQVDGNTNQHVSLRVVQEQDGVRVMVRSNDPALTQTLQERVPELTTKLEQHHYQTEVTLPERNVAGTFTNTNSGTNWQQDSSGRQQQSGQQGNPQNRQNQQDQKEQTDDDVFASLLGTGR